MGHRGCRVVAQIGRDEFTHHGRPQRPQEGDRQSSAGIRTGHAPDGHIHTVDGGRRGIGEGPPLVREPHATSVLLHDRHVERILPTSDRPTHRRLAGPGPRGRPGNRFLDPQRRELHQARRQDAYRRFLIHH